MKLSVIIIAKNEQDRIEAAIESAAFADEVVVIDNGSVDKTTSVAQKLHARVYEEDGHTFAELRNIGLAKANGDWIYYLDADERISAKLAEAIAEAIQGESFTTYKVQRKNYYLGNHEWPKIETLERLFKKDVLKNWRGDLHESPVFTGNVGVLDGYLIHYTHRSLSEMLTKTIEWSKIEAELRFQANHPQMSLWRFPRVMLTAFFDSYIKQGGWKMGTAGVVESIYQAFSMFITYARLWELQQKGKS